MLLNTFFAGVKGHNTRAWLTRGGRVAGRRAQQSPDPGGITGSGDRGEFNADSRVWHSHTLRSGIVSLNACFRIAAVPRGLEQLVRGWSPYAQV
jgi:hypothetical protein